MINEEFLEQDEIQTRIFGRPYSRGTPQEREEMERLGGHKDKCPAVVGKATRWAAELILAEMDRDGRFVKMGHLRMG